MLKAADTVVLTPLAPLAGGGGAGGMRGGGGGELGGRCGSVICYFSTRLEEVKPANLVNVVRSPPAERYSPFTEQAIRQNKDQWQYA
jgi:hypothetical protein